jgi:protein-S-isoprenylcysteine O-methyltransferase Ste14
MVILLATYLVQAVQVFWIKVPSAGSTVEMLYNVRADQGVSHNHPAKQSLESKLKVAMMISATAITALVFFLPLIVALFPKIADYLLPLGPEPPDSFRLAGMLLLVVGNLVSTAAACTLKRHVTFYAFGETKSLYTGGIYRFVRNPISTGLAAVYAGFFFYLPSVVMGAGFCIVVLNCGLRIRMEEIYLERTFGDRYRQYRRITGKYFPKINS